MEPEPVQPGMLIDICKYLDSLQYRVWRKMVTSVESGEWGGGQGLQAGEALHAGQSANRTHFCQLSTLSELLQPLSDWSLGALSTPCPTPFCAGRTPFSLGPDTRHLCRKRSWLPSLFRTVLYR